ncbi:MAG: hypothetical protein K6G76_02265 [Lachnospiraceae bacterium]|nr:hypothetical protein [Lachnospiraceae bacterium]
MDKNVFDKMSDSYESFHFKDTELHMGNDTLYISPKLKLILGWSLFVLCCVLVYAIMGNPFTSMGVKEKTEDLKQEVLKSDVDMDETHETILPYEKNQDEDLNAFIMDYFAAITACDNQKLQDMVTDASPYSSDELLKKKAEFITAYDNITVYTKDGPEEGSYVAFVVSNLTIKDVNSSPYDIVVLYIVNGAQGFKIMNSALPEETQEYIAKVKGDKDIQKVFQSVEKQNKKLVEKDTTLKDFYEIISRRNVEVNSGADVNQTATTESKADDTDNNEPENNETENNEADNNENNGTDNNEEPPAE